MSEEQNGFNNIVKKFISDIPYVQNTNEIKELEVRFQTIGKRRISKIDYDNVCKNLLSHGFKFIKNGIDLLRVSNEFTDRTTGRNKISNVRTEIRGIDNIKEYCKTNKLPDNSSSFNFIQKSINNTDKTLTNPFDVKPYNLRIAYSSENKINKGSNLGKSIIESWSESKKIFRFINRMSFTHPDYPVYIDCSIVKSSSKNNNNRFLLPTYTIEESNLFNNPEIYEIEIEVDNSKTEGLSPSDLNKMLMKCVKFVLAGLQQTNYPISYSEIDNIGMDYLKLIKNSSNYLKSSTFIGPSSLTLQMENIIQTDTETNIPNIRNDYTVTDKADGARKLLYISKTGLLYLINTNMNIEFTGAKSNNSNFYNSIIDGEHILHNKRGEFINLYAAFDVYFIKNSDVRAKSFVQKESTDPKSNHRLTLLSDIINQLELKGVTNSAVSPIRIELKKFYSPQGDNDIFMACKLILDRASKNEFEYETDGLIFTPSNYGVGLTKFNSELKPNKITWEYSFKWKPTKYNTIDFYITTKKLDNGSEFIGNIFKNGSDTTSSTQIIQYKTIILRVGFDEQKNGYMNPCLDVINDRNVYSNNTDDNDTYKPTPFYPTNPYDDTTHLCNIMLKRDSNGSLQMFTVENEVFTDNTIVEFSYDPNKENGWRWTPLRVRWDKTAELKSGGRNYGNNYVVANNNWQSIHNPITDEIISSGNISQSSSNNDTYYIKLSGKSNTKPLRDFHNLFVKKYLIKAVSQNGYTLIDLAVGKAGDFPKWNDSKLSFVFGIDLSKDNIENRLDGACARYLNYKKKFKTLPAALFVNGNSSMNIKNGDALSSEREKIITKAIFGIGEKNEKKIGKAVYKNYGKGKDGFNICSCQFALHYFFENPITLNNFLQNVTDTTKVGGYFIGCCYDGNKIFDDLTDKPMGEGIALFNNSNPNKDPVKIWEVIKQYDSNIFNDDESSIGYPIDIYQETIGKMFREYLVNFTYLIRLMEDYGFSLISKEEANLINLPNSTGLFSEMFSLMETEIKSKNLPNKHFGESTNMTDSEKQISFYNRYFVFRKERNVGTITIQKNTSNTIKIKPKRIKKLPDRIIIK